jgi:predicted RNase H-like HicB family nuclease
MSNTRVNDAVQISDRRDRPIDPKVVAQAQALAARYRVATQQSGSGYVGTVAEFPSVLGHGASKEDAIVATRDLLKWAIAYLIESGRTPAPSK